MDPITGIELAASVVQLGGFVISSVQTLSKIRDNLKNGSQDLRTINKAISSHQCTLQSKRSSPKGPNPFVK
jgi:hypothetical protein